MLTPPVAAEEPIPVTPTLEDVDCDMPKLDATLLPPGFDELGPNPVFVPDPGVPEASGRNAIWTPNLDCMLDAELQSWQLEVAFAAFAPLALLVPLV